MLSESAFGAFAVLGVGVSSLGDICLDLCLTMAFPIYLIALRESLHKFCVHSLID